jgi:hypothetical protein
MPFPERIAALPEIFPGDEELDRLRHRVGRGHRGPIAAAVAWSRLFKWAGIDSDGPCDVRPLTEFISNPDFFSFFVAYGPPPYLTMRSGAAD